MNRFAVGMLTLALLVVASASANAAAPEGPRLAILVQKYGQEMLMTGPLGEHPQQLIDSKKAVSGGPPSWSADGSRLAFAAHVPEDDDPVLGVADADGAHLRIYPDVPLELGDAVMAPDGSSA